VKSKLKAYNKEEKRHKKAEMHEEMLHEKRERKDIAKALKGKKKKK